jgi:two-component system, OmpR family, response regulator RpaA
MDDQKKVLTTGDVARLCSVAPRTVSKWFDSGELRGYRIPGSKDRRIPVAQLVRFMRANGMPLNGLDAGDQRILVLDADRDFAELLQAALVAEGRYDVFVCTTALEAGAAAAESKPHAVIVDISLTDVTPESMTQFFRSNADLEATALIGISTGLSETEGHALLELGFAGFLAKPFDVGALIRLIDRVTSPAASHAAV